MFCRNCGNNMNEDERYCPVCGAPQEPDQKPEKPEKVKKEKKSWAKRLLRVNWLGIIGLAAYIASICTGTTYFILGIIALVLCAIAVAIRKKHSLNFIAVTGLVLSCLEVSVVALAVLAVFGLVAGCKRLYIRYHVR